MVFYSFINASVISGVDTKGCMVKQMFIVWQRFCEPASLRIVIPYSVSCGTSHFVMDATSKLLGPTVLVLQAYTN